MQNKNKRNYKSIIATTLILISTALVLITFHSGARKKSVIDVDVTKAAGNTYYVSTAGSDTNSGTLSLPWKTITKAANTLVAGDTVYVRSGTYNERVIVKNSGIGTGYITFAAYSGEIPTIDGAGLSIAYYDGLFETSAKSYINIDGFNFINSPGMGIRVNPGSSYINIRNNKFKSVFAYSPIGVVWDGPNNYILIENNEIDRTAPSVCTDGSSCWAEMISISGANEVTVRNNHIYRNTVGEGIDFKDGADNGHIYNNIVENTSAVGIYVDARGVINNIDMYNNIVKVPNSDGIALANETVYPITDTNPGATIQTVNIYNNIIYNSLSGLRIGGWGPLSGTGIIKDINVINNVFYNNSENDVGYNGNTNVSNVIIRNNIFNKNTIVLYKGATADHNMFDTTCVGTSCTLGDPKFVNPASSDFHLQGTSPTIDKGSATGAPSTDFDGKSRPQGAGFDIGAYEYGLSSTPTPAPSSTPTPSPSFRFIAWGDTKWGTATFTTESKSANVLNPAFTIYAGDLVDCAANGSDNPTCFSNNFPAWKTALNGGETNNLFNKTFAIRGNHDANSDIPWQSNFEFANIANGIGATNYSAQTTDMTYSFDYGNSHFIGIDTPGADVDTITSAQITWLDNDLTVAENRGLKHAFLFWHGPIYQLESGGYRPEPPAALITVINKHPIISAGFFGHEHFVTHTSVNSNVVSGITCPFEEFITGGAGAELSTVDTSRNYDYHLKDSSGNSLYGYMAVDVSGNNFTVNVYKADGTLDRTLSFNESGSCDYTPPPASKNLVAYYKLNETSGTTAYDSSGKSNTGTLTNFQFNSADGWTTGKVNNGLKFDGIDDYVNAGHSATVSSITYSITLESWVYLKSTATLSSRGDIVGKSGVAGSDQYQFGVLNSRKLNFTSEGGPNVASTGSIVNDTWQHIAVTYDSSNVKFYINGVLDSSFSATGGLSSSGGNDLVLGRSGTTYGNLFNGIIDEVKIYNRDLSASEVLADYNGGGSPTPTSTPSLTPTSTPTPTPTITPTPTPALSNIHGAGWRSSEYGHQYDLPSSYWINTANQMSSKFSSSTPSGVYVVGELNGDPGTTASTYLSFPKPSTGTYTNIVFDAVDKNNDYLTAFDNAGLKVWLQVEPADASVDQLIDLVLNQYQSHPSVKGFGIDVEWLNQKNNPNGRPVTNAEVQNWINRVKSHNSNYKLFLKHWDSLYLGTIRPAGVVYITDDQNFGSYSSAISEYTAWANYFSPSEIGYQIGYPADQPWWSVLSDPARQIGNAISVASPNANIDGIYWVDFSIISVFPPTSSAPSSPQSLSSQSGNNVVSLTWLAPSSNGGSPITSYKIYKGTASGAETYLASSATLTYTDNTVTNNTTYYYQVTAINSIGESVKSNETMARPSATQIQGTVTNTSNVPISGATVSDGTRSATTDSQGNYTISSIPAGTYTVTASASTYISLSKTNIIVTNGQITTVNFSLSKPTSADFNSDGKVNSIDFGIMMSFWGNATKPKADINQDGTVNSVDFGILMSQWTG